ncbi:MAG: hypothetical protein E7444_07135 [Ruminococcaceae bacterium]|nr:hypothetical protein [Oscillospiraceae bacterium]
MRQIKPDNKRDVSAVTGLVGGRSTNRYNIKQRYEVYANSDKRRSKAVRSGLCILICLVFLASYFVIVQPIYLPPEEDLVGVVTAVENTSTFIAWDGERYVLFVGAESVMELRADQLDDEPYCNFQIFEVGE